MWNFGLIGFCIGAGWAMRRTGRLPSDAWRALNAFVLQISLPALVLVEIHRMNAPNFGSKEFLMPALMPWIVLAGAIVIGLFLRRKLRWSPGTTGAFMLTAGLGNTSFVGFPAVEALLGKEALPYALISDQLGSFLAISTAGIAIAAVATSGSAPSATAIFKRILFFPPFIALAAGFASRAWHWPAGLEAALAKLGGTLTPLALVSVGSQLRWDRRILARERTNLGLGLAYKLALAPALILVAYGGLFAAPGLSTQTSVLEAAMAPMITAAVVCADFGLDPDFANLMVSVGIPASLLTAPLWAAILQWQRVA